MRFILVEGTPGWTPSSRLVQGYSKKLKHDEQVNFIKTYILTEPVFKNLFGIRRLILQSILDFGLEPRHNEFLGFTTELSKKGFNFKDKQRYYDKFDYIYKSFQNKKLDLDQDFLKNFSLYDRGYKDFTYTLNALNLVSDENKLSSFLKDSSKVDISELMNGDTIKPSGLDKRDKNSDTIYGVIERWANGNEYTEKERRERAKSDSNLPKVGTDELKKLYDEGQFKSRNDIEDELRRDGKLKRGTVIYARTIEHISTNDLNGDNAESQLSGQSFWWWDGSSWKAYETSETEKIIP